MLMGALFDLAVGSAENAGAVMRNRSRNRAEAQKEKAHEKAPVWIKGHH